MFQVRWWEPVAGWLAETHAGMAPDEQVRLVAGLETFHDDLRRNPEEVGESRSGGFRIAFPPLLAVGFLIDPARRTVWVTRAKRYGR